jgi:hypothetical protein
MYASTSKLNILKTKTAFELNFQGVILYTWTASSGNFSSLREKFRCWFATRVLKDK